MHINSTQKDRTKEILEKSLRFGPLDIYLKVAVQIYALEDKGEKVWYDKLVEQLDGVMTATEIMLVIPELVDFEIIRQEFGETSKGRAGKLIFITDYQKDTIKRVYERHYKTPNKKKEP
ncbi:MAG: hypothetical protein Q7T34_01500, partial [Candidatus Parcubacteria bacterium]|nr:hypothetical protein [Candidatus Parcubacteria bacterium]